MLMLADSSISSPIPAQDLCPEILAGGVGDTFRLFGTSHLLMLALGGGFIAWYVVSARQVSRQEQAEWTRLLLIALLLCFPLSFVFRLFLSPSISWQERLPFHLCSIVPFIGAWALWKGSHRAMSLTYFWGVLLCTQALLTPALSYDFPHPIYFEFFITHLVILLAALYIPIVLDWRARPRDFLYAYGTSVGYMLSMLILNPLLDTNFGFVIHAPAGGSILDLLGTWPWYLFSLQPLAFGLLWIIGLPVLGRKK